MAVRQRGSSCGTDFSKAPWDRIDFRGFQFGHWVDFSGCRWRGIEQEEFREDPPSFVAGCANFVEASFRRANFSDAFFGRRANFSHADFQQDANFTGAIFGNNANFTDANFRMNATFSDAAFGNEANFAGAAFGDFANFSKAHFKGRVEFNGKPPPPRDKKIVEQHHGYFNWPNERFSTISFAKARFDGEADSSDCSFERVAEFTSVRFYCPPDFDAATGLHRIDFSNACIGFALPGKLHWTSDIQVSLHLRALRKIAEETKNHDLERDLYIEERKAERGVYLRQHWEGLKKEGWKNWPRNIARLATHVLWIAVISAYWALADYGRSFVRPFSWLAASVYFFDWRYKKVLALLMAKAPDVDKYKQVLGMLALGNAVPFVGPLTIDTKIKEFLFCPNNATSCLPPIPPEGFQFWVILQNVFSITCVFFIVLALRNYFRIK